ncbi:MAG: D-tyrosyl-tRNA(Tyr) deacylase [candidate division Zixibacteria bacterium SM23_73_2]|nr:MAG: D-tyrosyl-tRNA(Tyr) deacylase [candidate division Zixibacteria bacterium SM23_73_2]
MKVVLQRVKEASVEVDQRKVGEIGKGLTLLVGAKNGDTEKDCSYLADKVVNLRIFEDNQGKMNLSALDMKAEILVISQFTLYGDASKGRRPSFTGALEPREAERLYLKFVQLLKEKGLRVKEGIFGAKMLVKIFNWGPVTFILESR